LSQSLLRMQLRWRLHGAHFQNQVPNLVFVCAALFLAMFAMPVALIAVIVDGLKKTDPDVEID